MKVGLGLKLSMDGVCGLLERTFGDLLLLNTRDLMGLCLTGELLMSGLSLEDDAGDVFTGHPFAWRELAVMSSLLDLRERSMDNFGVRCEGFRGLTEYVGGGFSCCTSPADTVKV